MKKKLLVIMLATTMVFEMTACGQTEKVSTKEETVETKEDEDASSQEEEQKEEPEEQAEESRVEQVSTDNAHSVADMPIKNPIEGNLKPSEGFEYDSNGDGTCSIVKVGSCSDKDIVIPQKSPDGDTITSIGSYAFYQVEADRIIFDGLEMEIDESAFSSCEYGELIIVDCKLKMNNNAFAYAKKAKSLTILNSEIETKEYVFYEAGKDMYVGIGNSKISLDESTFSSGGLGSIEIYNCTGSLNNNAFAYNDDVTKIDIVGCELEIGEYVFYEVGDEAEVRFESSSITMEDSACSSNGFGSLTITKCDMELGDNAFAYGDHLKSFEFSDGNLKTKEYVFYESKRLTAAVIKAGDDNDLNLGDSFMTSCDKLESVELSGKSVTIGDNAFAYNESLKSINIKADEFDAGDYVTYGAADNLSVKLNGKGTNLK